MYLPLGVPIIHNIELALPQRIPELDTPIPRSRDDLSVIRGERNTNHQRQHPLAKLDLVQR